MTIFENVFLSYESKGTGKFECKIKTEIKFLKITSRIIGNSYFKSMQILKICFELSLVKKLSKSYSNNLLDEKNSYIRNYNTLHIGGYVQCTVRNWNLCFRERGFRTEDSCLLSARNICYWHSRSLTKNGKTNLILHSHFRKRFMELCVAWFTINVTIFRGWIKKTNTSEEFYEMQFY